LRLLAVAPLRRVAAPCIRPVPGAARPPIQFITPSRRALPGDERDAVAPEGPGLFRQLRRASTFRNRARARADRVAAGPCAGSAGRLLRARLRHGRDQCGGHLEIHFVDSSGVISWDFLGDTPDFPFADWNFSSTTAEDYAWLCNCIEAEGKDIYVADFTEQGVYSCRACPRFIWWKIWNGKTIVSETAFARP
jgi:hypothetical protein